ncbi:signal peptidase II [Candidatus Peregrinibacteria bacterium]|jgi:signal peptidase II|nr:signal peptidase II [Candidatus Peregrinibacteria bacterium]MBT7736322.1 signal peptidase II [Candidatus Peregrinibacteria bacterium]
MAYRIIKTIHISIWLLIVDQFTKRLSLNIPEEGMPIINNFLEFKYSENFGIAFSIPVPKTALLIATIGLLIFLTYYLVKELNLKKYVSQAALALIWAGGFGNLIDRIFRGYVVDFISIWKWPIFNVADVYILAGVLLLIGFYAKIKKV